MPAFCDLSFLLQEGRLDLPSTSAHFVDLGLGDFDISTLQVRWWPIFCCFSVNCNIEKDRILLLYLYFSFDTCNTHNELWAVWYDFSSRLMEVVL